MQLYIPLSLPLAGLGLAQTSVKPCVKNNCARAVAGTRIPGQTATASADCSGIVGATTVAASTITVSITATEIIMVGLAKRQPSPFIVPSYASACTDYAAYSSACSCFGITGGTVTAPAATVTETVATVTETVTAGGPSCTADIKNDPQNCGDCGNICSSGVCSNGVCSSEECTGQTCGGFTNCNPNNTNCFCFSAAETKLHPDTNTVQNIGFCGQNAACSDLTPCSASTDCNMTSSTGNVCAVNTCCGAAGCVWSDSVVTGPGS